MEAKTEATRREFLTWLKGVEARAEGGRETETGAAKSFKFDGTISWAVVERHFETVVENNCRTRLEKSTYLTTALHGQATDVVLGVLKGATSEKPLEDQEDSFWDQILAAAYISKLKTRTQGVEENMQVFSTEVEQLTYRVYTALPKNNIRRKVGNAFTDGIEDLAIKPSCC
jgi:hypothetical protein